MIWRLSITIAALLALAACEANDAPRKAASRGASAPGIVMSAQSTPPRQVEAQPDAPGLVRGRVPFDISPHEAVDHIVVFHAPSDEGENRVTRTRSGRWVREERRSDDGQIHIDITDFENAAHYMWTRALDGSSESLNARIREPRYEMMIGHNTGAREQELGETCSVWAWAEADQEPNEFVRRTMSCVTDDGVELWRKQQWRDGEVREMFRALSVERRRLRLDEVAPPSRLFNWNNWLDAAGDRPAADAAGYEVQLEGEKEFEGQREIVRARGEWSYTETITPPSRLRVMVSAPNLNLHYAVHERGTHLSVHRGVRPPVPEGYGSEPLSPRREETILGRRCVWIDAMPMNHSYHHACRTRDRVVLARIDRCDNAQGGNCNFSIRAMRMAETAPPASAFTPPAQAFVWPISR